MEADIDGLVQDRSNSSALGMDLLQFCTKPSIYNSQRMFYTWLAGTANISYIATIKRY